MIRRLGRLFRSPGLLLFALVTAAYGVYEELSVSRTQPFSVAGVVAVAADTSTNQQFESFVILSAWGLYLLARTNYSFGYPERIRLGSYLRTALWNCRAGFAVVLVGLAACAIAWVLSAAIIAVFSRGRTGSAAGTLQLDPHGVPAATVVVIQFVALAVAAMVIQLGLEAVRAHTDRLRFRVILLSVIWLWGALSASGFIPDWILSFDRFMDFGLVLQNPTLGVQALVVEFAAVVVSVSYLRRLDRVARTQTSPSSPLFALLILGLAAVFTAALATNRGMTAFTAVASVLSGSSGTILASLTSICVWVGFAFVFQLRAERELGGWIMLTLVRHGSWGRFLRATLSTELVRVIAYLGCIAVGSFALYFLVGGRNFTTTTPDLTVWVYQFVVNGTLQLAVYVLVTLGAILIFRSRLAGLATVGILATLALIPTSSNSLVPVQLSRLTLSYGGWPLVAPATLILATTALVHER